MKKGDARRQAILKTAHRLFQERGFERTSMSDITRQAGGSKATLYRHFASKEVLFVECMTSAIEHSMNGQLDFLGVEPGEMDVALQHFGESYLRFLCLDNVVASRRLIIAEASSLGIGQLFFDKICILRDRVVAFLVKCMDARKLRREDPVLTANHLRGLLEAEVGELLEKTPRPGHLDIVQASKRAIRTFIRGYAINPKE